MTIALIVEDGTGTVAGANTYVSADDATTYWANRANTVWAAASSDQQAAALIQATQYLDARYTYKGIQLLSTQPLVWPRKPEGFGAFGCVGDIVAVWAGDPRELAMYQWPVARLISSCCEAALRALSGSLYSDEDAAIITNEKVDTISVTYANHAKNGGQVRIAIIDDLLQPYLSSGRYNLALVRA